MYELWQATSFAQIVRSESVVRRARPHPAGMLLGVCSHTLSGVVLLAAAPFAALARSGSAEHDPF
jgi:hypothetical protein